MDEDNPDDAVDVMALLKEHYGLILQEEVPVGWMNYATWEFYK